MKKLFFVVALLKCVVCFSQTTILQMNTNGQLVYVPVVGMSTSVFIASADKSVTNTPNETSIVGTGSGTLTIPANFLTVGKTYRIRIAGVYSTPPVTAASVVIKIKLGSTVIATGTASSLLINATNAAFVGTGTIVCRSTGTSGSVITDGQLQYSVGNNLSRLSLDLNNSGSVTTIDTTASQLLDVTVTWDSASTSKIIKATTCTVEVLN